MDGMTLLSFPSVLSYCLEVFFQSEHILQCSAHMLCCICTDFTDSCCCCSVPCRIPKQFLVVHARRLSFGYDITILQCDQGGGGMKLRRGSDEDQEDISPISQTLSTMIQKGTVANPNDFFAASFNFASRKRCVIFLCDLHINRRKIYIHFRDRHQ
jgi:hypothetical protein